MMNKDYQSVEFRVRETDEGLLLQKYLERVQGISAKAVRRLKHQGAVLLNGQKTRMNVHVRAGDQIVLQYPPKEASSYLAPEPLAVDIIYEDKEIMVVNKPSHQCVHPTKGYPGGTLANGVLYHWQVKGEAAQLHLVNRLDRDTSGLLLIAKSAYAAQQLFTQQKSREIKKSYLALVTGRVEKTEGTLDFPIAKLPGRTTRRIVAGHGQSAVTHYKVRGRFKDRANGQDYSYLSVFPETGRTHQIRVHFSHWGYPLAGDELYGGQIPAGLKRQFLHANYLAFYHPLTKEKMEFCQELPGDLADYLNGLEPVLSY